jgi:hypothetical protein
MFSPETHLNLTSSLYKREAPVLASGTYQVQIATKRAASVDSRRCNAEWRPPEPIAYSFGRNWLDEDHIGSGPSLGPFRKYPSPRPRAVRAAMTDQRQPMEIEYLRCELLDRVDAHPFDDWSPALLRALIAVFDLNGVTPAARRGFRPYLVR